MTSYPDLRGKSAIVTGGSAGIGEAICRAFGVEGVNVLVNGRANREAAERVASDLRARGVEALAVLADMSRSEEVARMVAAAETAFGRVDILVNNAGGFPRQRLLLEIDEDEWDRIIAANLRSTFLCSKAVLPGMLERGWGRIVNIASTAGRTTLGISAAHYAASKAGQLGFTRHLAHEVAARGVTVNATCPGTTVTPRVQRVYETPEGLARVAAELPIGRLAEPQDQAGVVVFLCSEAASYITGATIDVAGGRVMM